MLITFGLFHSLEGELSQILETLNAHPLQFGVASFLILAGDIVLPVPSSIVLYINGFFLGAISGTAVSLGGLMVGCIIGYYLGKVGASFLKPERNSKADIILKKYGTAAIFLTRGIPILSESICFVCGYNRIPFKHYLLLNLIGYFPVCLLHAVFGSMGYKDANTFLLSFACSIALSIGFWFFGNKIIQVEDWATHQE